MKRVHATVFLILCSCLLAGSNVSGQETASPTIEAGTVRMNSRDGLKYVWIPAGTFQMGCSPGDSDCRYDEKPSHAVTLSKGFWLGQTDVTVGAYERFSKSSRRPLPTAAEHKDPMSGDLPATDVSWEDAQAYCKWARGRLPTEAEWEYAARGGSTESRYGPIDQIAWYAANSGDGPHEVAQKRPNAFGLFDMLGNVWQWVADWHGGKYYEHSPQTDPTGPQMGGDRVLRGGSWSDPPKNVRVSVRSRTKATGGVPGVGFRCACNSLAP